ncbi:MAG: phosphate-starvation-inducible PsiE family protein [Deltaproteobacteria bacterium]|nr:phosphate-starvation-inducible PsiE family protein [Deltaproteobacteria bacterium]
MKSTSQLFERVSKALLCLLIAALLGAIAIGVGQAFLDLRFVWRLGVHEGFRQILVDSLTILAVVEVFRTAMAYFVEGRVKVTYIIDTVLVTVLTEVLAFWFKDMDTARIAMVIALVLSLTLVRILAIHFSPNRAEVADGL